MSTALIRPAKQRRMHRILDLRPRLRALGPGQLQQHRLDIHAVKLVPEECRPPLWCNE